MIDTIKIFSMINYKTYNSIKSQSIVKTSYHNKTGEILYIIINDSINGSYGSSLSVRVNNGAKYKFTNMYSIEIEGSYHKLKKGYNSHNGYYNIISISKELISIVENAYKIKLPNFKHWFLQRCDIAICYDLQNQQNISNYINNLSFCNFPKRKIKHYENESIYITGNTTTIKIYNKMQEFKKHDLSNLKNTDFNIENYLNTIKGYIRFECELKKSKLKYYYKKYYIRIHTINYKELKEIWYEEFSKFYKNINNDLSIVRKKDDIKKRLFSLYSSVRTKNLFNFYLLIQVQGLQNIKKDTNRSMYYKNIADLKKARIDFSQKLDTNLSDNTIDFNPFNYEEIL